MRQFVESLARLYKAGKISQEHLNKMLRDKKISQEEYKFITSK